MTILGISCFYHDSSACLIKNGHILAAAAEERFTRQKHDNSFPINAINYCLSAANSAANQLDQIVFYEKPIQKFDRFLHQHLDAFPKSFPTFVASLPTWTSEKLAFKRLLRQKLHYLGPIHYLPHHLSHAASTYYLSPFKHAVIVTLDGVGEWSTTTRGIGHHHRLTIEDEIRFPHSLGLLYSTLTAYLGFQVNNSEYKVMGLAAYGNPRPYQDHFDHLITQFEDGSFRLNLDYFDFTWSDHMPSPRMIELFGHPQRQPESKLYSYHQNIAAALQHKLESVILHLLTQTHHRHPLPNLCLAGGVALNSVTNGKIISHTPFKHLYIPPDPGDGGGAMGAALYQASQSQKTKPSYQFTPYLGPSFDSFHIRHLLHQNHLTFHHPATQKALLEMVTKALIEQQVVGWFQGRMEWGPRALGNRSILAAADQPQMKDILNLKVKKREQFRPFAPVILRQHVNNIFHAQNEPESLGMYMLTVLPFTKAGKKLAPATVHVNNTGRPQYLKSTDNPLYYNLINMYYKKTGIPLLINTSFNVRGEPIVCTPEEAIACYLKTDIALLVIDRYIVKKSNV